MTETAPRVEITVEGEQEFGHDAEHVQEDRCLLAARGDSLRGSGGGTLGGSGESHLPERPKRRSFTAEDKLRIVREADEALASGGEASVGALLRREGLYSSYLAVWRRERDDGELAGLTPKPRGRKPQRNPLVDENARLQREVEKLQHELYKANTIIDVQKNPAAPQ